MEGTRKKRAMNIARLTDFLKGPATGIAAYAMPALTVRMIFYLTNNDVLFVDQPLFADQTYDNCCHKYLLSFQECCLWNFSSKDSTPW